MPCVGGVWELFWGVSCEYILEKGRGVGGLPGVGGYLGDEDVGGCDGGVDDVGHFCFVGWGCCWLGECIGYGWSGARCFDDL